MPPRALLPGTDRRRGLEPVHVRHLDVHQHQVEAAFLDRPQRLASVLHRDHDVPLLLEEPRHHAAVDEIVLRHEDGQGPPMVPQGVARHELLPGVRDGGVQHGAHRLQELQRVDRLGEIAGDPQLTAARGVASLPGRGQHDDLEVPETGLRADRLRHHEAVLLRQLDVEEHQGARRSLVARAAQGLQGGVAALDRQGREPPGSQHFDEVPAVGRVVVHDQDGPSLECLELGAPGAPGAPHRLQADAGGEGEDAAAARRALDRDPATHHLDELGGDRQAQPGAAVAPRGRSVDLGERLEDQRLLLRRNPDPRVNDVEPQNEPVAATILHPDPHRHLAAFGELDRVPDQVDQHLAQAARVAHETFGDLGVDPVDDLDPLLMRARPLRPEYLAQEPLKRERHGVQLQPPRLDLREVEDVVQDREQPLRGRLHGLQVFALLRREVGLEGQIGHPQDAVHRRADLVRHVRHELGLEARGLQRAELGPRAFLHLLPQPPGALLHPRLQGFVGRLEGAIALLDVSEHLVEGVDERPHLVHPAPGNAHREVLLQADAPGGLRQASDRIGDHPLQARGEQQGHERGRQQGQPDDEGAPADGPLHLPLIGRQNQGPDPVVIKHDGRDQLQMARQEPEAVRRHSGREARRRRGVRRRRGLRVPARRGPRARRRGCREAGPGVPRERDTVRSVEDGGDDLLAGS